MDPEAFLVGLLVIAALTVAGLWGVFAKAGRPGWHALVPVLNMVTLCRVCGVSPWLAAATLIPLINIVTMIYLADRLSRSFGKGLGHTLGISFLGFVFLPMLAFGRDAYAPLEEDAAPQEA